MERIRGCRPGLVSLGRSAESSSAAWQRSPSQQWANPEPKHVEHGGNCGKPWHSGQIMCSTFENRRDSKRRMKAQWSASHSPGQAHRAFHRKAHSGTWGTRVNCGAGNPRNFAEFASHCDRVLRGHSMMARPAKGVITMPSRIWRLIGSTTFVCALLSLSAPAGAQNQVSCLSAPPSDAPQNSHWYYRTNRTTQRKCWHLRTADQSGRRGAQTAQDPTTSDPLPTGHINPSDKAADELYADFLKWRDHQIGYDSGKHR